MRIDGDIEMRISLPPGACGGGLEKRSAVSFAHGERRHIEQHQLRLRRPAIQQIKAGDVVRLLKNAALPVVNQTFGDSKRGRKALYFRVRILPERLGGKRNLGEGRAIRSGGDAKGDHGVSL